LVVKLQPRFSETSELEQVGESMKKKKRGERVGTTLSKMAVQSSKRGR